MSRKAIPADLTISLCRNQERFGALFHELCEVSGLTQGKLARAATVECRRLIRIGFIHANEQIGSMSQSAISQVLAGVRPPTYYQVYIWLRVLRKHFKSDTLIDSCEFSGIPIPTFSRTTEKNLWNLATFLPPEELDTVFEESLNEKPLEANPTLIDHKELRWERKSP